MCCRGNGQGNQYYSDDFIVDGANPANGFYNNNNNKIKFPVKGKEYKDKKFLL